MPISLILILIVVAGWAWVLGRPLLASMLDRGRQSHFGQFNSQYSGLSKSVANGSSNTYGRPGAASNRRRTLIALVIAAVFSLLLALVFGGIFVAQHLLLDAALIGFVLVAARTGSIESERRSKVSYLGSQAQSTPAPYLRAVGDR